MVKEVLYAMHILANSTNIQQQKITNPIPFHQFQGIRHEQVHTVAPVLFIQQPSLLSLSAGVSLALALALA